MTDAPLPVEDIVANALCIGCGLCQSLAGDGRLRLEMTAEGRERPHVLQDIDVDLLGRINAVCPGLVVVGLEQADDPIWGRAARLAIGHAGEPEIRHMAATGGVLTALAVFLLETGKVDFVLHVAPRQDRPMRWAPKVSRTRTEVLAGSGSRYGPAAPLTGFMDLLDQGRPFAVVAKPCDIGAIANLARIDARVDELVRFRLVMVCGGASEFGKTLDLIVEHGLSEDDVAALRYRGYGNPGPTTIDTHDGRRFTHTYKEMWEDEGTWQLQNRCKICPDAIGELADIAALDVWPGGNPVGEDDGFNGIIARTPAGAALLEEAVAAGALVITGDMSFRDLDDYQPHQVRKKRAVHDRLRGIADAGAPVPRFDNLRLAELAEDSDAETRQRSRNGMRQRIENGRAREPVPGA